MEPSISAWGTQRHFFHVWVAEVKVGVGGQVEEVVEHYRALGLLSTLPWAWTLTSKQFRSIREHSIF